LIDCDWLKQLKRFTAVLAETKKFKNSFKTVLFHLNCADWLYASSCCILLVTKAILVQKNY